MVACAILSAHLKYKLGQLLNASQLGYRLRNPGVRFPDEEQKHHSLVQFLKMVWIETFLKTDKQVVILVVLIVKRFELLPPERMVP